MSEFLKRSDYDDITKEFYTSVKKKTERLSKKDLEIVKMMCKIFDDVTKCYKNSVKE